MLRDRIVVGLRDGTMSEKLQMDRGLALETAKKRVRQNEAVKDQSRQLREETKDHSTTLGEMKIRNNWPKKGGTSGHPSQTTPKKRRS